MHREAVVDLAVAVEAGGIVFGTQLPSGRLQSGVMRRTFGK
jgi:hypothetical protein